MMGLRTTAIALCITGFEHLGRPSAAFQEQCIESFVRIERVMIPLARFFGWLSSKVVTGKHEEAGMERPIHSRLPTMQFPELTTSL